MDRVGWSWLARERARSLKTLRRWHGSPATMQELTCSLQSLVIRIGEEGSDLWLQVYCSGPEYIQGPTYWRENRIEIEDVLLPTGEECVAIFDIQAGLRVIARSFGVYETRKPLRG